MEAQSAYSFRIGYNASEILLDFGKVTRKGGRAKIQSRIRHPPAFARMKPDALTGYSPQSAIRRKQELPVG